MSRAKPQPFTALMLDEPSKALLREMLPPCHAKAFGDHVTLEHAPNAPMVGEFRGFARVVEVRADDKAQAVGVLLDEGSAALLKGQWAHVTLSVAPGVQPEHSNSLPPGAPLPFGLVLFGTVKTVTPA